MNQQPVNRDQAWQLLTSLTTKSSLIKHALAVEAAMRAYAEKFGQDIELWGLVGLLHDFDWEIHPTLQQHPAEGAKILREKGYPEVIIDAILSHADSTVAEHPRYTLLKKTLFAVDELCGFITACALVRPQRLEGMKAKSVRKKLKDKAFAAAVNRDDIIKGAEQLGVELNEHIEFVIAALARIAEQLDLAAPPARQNGQ